MNLRKLLLVGVIVALVGGFIAFGGPDLLTLDNLQKHQASLDQWISENLLLALGGFFVVYVAVTALSLPGAAILTLAGGAFFGNLFGLIAVSLASTLGATLAFFTARFLLRDTLRERYRETVNRIDRGVQKDGAFYLATLRLVPVFPFFVINLAMGLTGMRVVTYVLVSWLAMLPGTFVYVNAGTQLAQIDRLGDIVSAEVLISLALLGVFPLIAKVAIGWIRRRRLYKGYQRPSQYDANLLVIGAGSGGLVASYIAAAVKAKVILVERHQMGGDCLNTGCVPSKALIRSARTAYTIRHADRYGLAAMEPEGKFADIMSRVRRVIRQIEPHDSPERYRKLGVDCVFGEARFITPWEVEVALNDGGTRRMTARSIVIASGGRPALPPIEGLADMEPLTSDNLWSLQDQPGRLLVLGGGPIGCELAQAFHRLGSQVIQVERAERLLGKEDPDISDYVLQQFRQEGLDVRLNHEARRFAVEEGQNVVYCIRDGEEVRIVFDRVLVALGRSANTDSLNLEAIGIEPEKNGTLPTEDDLSVRFPHIFACGDVAGPYQFTHVAAHQAWYAAVNGLFGQFKRFRADYRVIPWVTFTSPEVARVGLSEAEAKAQGIEYEVTSYGLDDLDRAIAESDNEGVIKVLTPPGKDKILGAVIAGPHAAELLAEFTLAMKHNLGLNKILGTIHPYPTWNEAAKYLAGQWKQNHKPNTLLKWVEKFHRWRLGR